jgi:hypothetical protein
MAGVAQYPLTVSASPLWGMRKADHRAQGSVVRIIAALQVEAGPVKIYCHKTSPKSSSVCVFVVASLSQLLYCVTIEDGEA